MSIRSVGIRGFAAGGLLLAGLVLAPGCSDDDHVPIADREVKVRRDTFFPDSISVAAGERVRWVNILSQSAQNTRTVTSGEGPGDPEAGSLFDATLQGYAPGNAVGDYFVYQFLDPGRYPYFTRLPTGDEFSGVIIVF